MSVREDGRFRRYAGVMPLREDDVAPRTGVPDRRVLIQAAGFVLAIAATLAVFLTENAQVLRLAVVGVAWAFVLATIAAGRRSTDRVTARAREAELRRAYESELEREVAARREYELELEAELRREAEESMRAELDALRADLAGLSGFRDELARVADVRADITVLSSLRDEVARVAALRDDVAALASLRQELGQVAELRADMGRLRAELTEQLSSEMLIERIVMRTQASRLGSELHDAPGRALDAATRWSDDAPPRELTGGWPAVRLDEPRETRHFEQVRVEHATARPPVPPSPVSPPAVPPTTTWQAAPPPWEAPAWQGPSWETPATASWETPVTASSLEDRWSTPTSYSEDEATPLWSATAQADTGGHQVRPATPAPVPPTGPPTVLSPPSSPLEWLAARSLIDAEPTSFRPEVPPRRRRGDAEPADPAAAPTMQRPAVSANPPIRIDDRGGYRVRVQEEQPTEPPATPAQEKRLADILAENGAGPPSGGRRRRRYRDEDEPDDVLARVLGTN